IPGAAVRHERGRLPHLRSKSRCLKGLLRQAVLAGASRQAECERQAQGARGLQKGKACPGGPMSCECHCRKVLELLQKPIWLPGSQMSKDKTEKPGHERSEPEVDKSASDPFGIRMA